MFRERHKQKEIQPSMFFTPRNRYDRVFSGVDLGMTYNKTKPIFKVGTEVQNDDSNNQMYINRNTNDKNSNGLNKNSLNKLSGK